ncbi:MAG: DUF2182 domain-containing protein [Actinomycetota bacterium]|nr:DUF2182 domain-containing protein [Actinomycetota bacterium]MDQ2956284.1 DUF2182 domain-containing protein [Actinomycetota bacterium]
MASVGAVLARPRQQPVDLHRLLLRRPELPATVVVGLAWLVLLALAIRGWYAGGDSMVGIAGPAGMAGMAGSAGPAGSWWSAVSDGLPYTLVMAVAMMGPAALGGVRHTGVNSLRWRRGRAMTEFALAYLAVWLAYQLLVLAVVPVLPAVPGRGALCLVLAASAAWQFTPYKRRWLRDCHLSVPLPPSGWRAERAAMTFGLRNGLSCLGSCWCLMLVMAVAPAGYLLWSVALSGLITTERLLQRPRRATRLAAVALGVAAIWTFTLGLA